MPKNSQFTSAAIDSISTGAAPERQGSGRIPLPAFFTDPSFGKGRAAAIGAISAPPPPPAKTPAAKRGRPAMSPAISDLRPPDGNLPASCGADEAGHRSIPIEHAPRQQSHSSSLARGADEAEIVTFSVERAPRQQKVAKAKAKASPGGQRAVDPQMSPAAGATELDGHALTDPRTALAVKKDRRTWKADIRYQDPAVYQITNFYRLYRRAERARLKLILQAHALIRDFLDLEKDEGGDVFKKIFDASDDARRSWMLQSCVPKAERKAAQFNAKMDAALAAEKSGHDIRLINAVMPMLAAMLPLEDEAATCKKEITRVVKTMPLYAWKGHFPGLSEVGLGTIIGECGDLTQYVAGVSGIWSRLGLAPYKGEAVTMKRKGLTAEEWVALGYVGRRRSAIWNIGNSIIGGMGNGPRPLPDEDWRNNPDYNYYEKLFIERLIYEAERDPEKHDKGVSKTTGRRSFSVAAKARAKRYVEKRAVKRLLMAWRASNRGLFPKAQ